MSPSPSRCATNCIKNHRIASTMKKPPTKKRNPWQTRFFNKLSEAYNNQGKIRPTERRNIALLSCFMFLPATPNQIVNTTLSDFDDPYLQLPSEDRPYQYEVSVGRTKISKNCLPWLAQWIDSLNLTDPGTHIFHKQTESLRRIRVYEAHIELKRFVARYGFGWDHFHSKLLPHQASPHRPTWVYFIQEAERGYIKIGCSSSPFSRVRACQAGNPFDLRIIGIMEGNRSLELELHQRFQRLQMRGEWFKPYKELILYIESNTVGAEVPFQMHQPPPPEKYYPAPMTIIC